MTKIEHYILSTIITFAAGFSIAILPDLSHLTLVDIQTGAYVGAIFGAVRAGVKLVIEGFVAWYANNKQIIGG